MIVLEVTAKGPILRPDAAGKMKDAEQAIISRLLEMGEERLAEMLRPRPAGVYLSVQEAQKGKASTGHYRRNLQTRMNSGFGIISDGGVIYGPWLEGTSSRNQTTRFKGYAAFRRTGEWLQTQADRVSGEIVTRLQVG